MTPVPVGDVEQRGASIALAAIDRDHEGIAILLDLTDTDQIRAAVAVALGALAELALTARPHNITKARDALRRIHGRGPGEAL